MPDGSEAVTVRVVDHIGDIAAAQWDRCAIGGGVPYNPFLSHAFLDALEVSGSVSDESGWRPHHLVIEDERGELAGAAPLYLKSNSYGEYVFDHAWAHAFERAGGRYYPKLQCAVPFTPVTGPRLLARAGSVESALSPDTVRSALAAALAEATHQRGASSVHVTFCTEEEAAFLDAAGFLIRHGHQFHWFNRGYETFDDFLGALNSRKRKSIRRERKKVADVGIRMRALSGDEIEPAHWDAFYRFYVDTYDRKWGYPYLTRSFFGMLQETMAEDVVLFIAELEGEPIAGALNFRGEDALFGRNWGCDLRFKFLHFEACYYSAIEYAIEHGLRRVEAGTQGPHKLQRGYRPVATYSAHWIPDRNFHSAVADYLRRERHAEVEEMAELRRISPYRAESV